MGGDDAPEVAELDRRCDALLGPARSGPVGEADLRAALAALDLTSLEPGDTDEVADRLAERALQPDPARDDLPHAAAVCVLPHLVPAAARALAGTSIRVATVAGAFPTGVASIPEKVAEAVHAVELGAHEVDLVCDWRAAVTGDAASIEREVAAVRAAVPGTLLKVILETGALGEPATIRAAAAAALVGGADLLKTATGKTAAGATLPAVLLLLEAADAHERTAGRPVGVKASGGLRRAEQARDVLALARCVRGPAGAGPVSLRLGASSLLDDLVARLARAEDA